MARRYIDAEKLAQKVLELEDKLTPRKTFEAEIQYRFLVNVITPMIVSAPTEDVVSATVVADGFYKAETEEAPKKPGSRKRSTKTADKEEVEE